MAGLPCDTCQEETVVIPTGQVGEDEDGTLIYRRFRVCVNPKCERYRQRRETAETFLPGEGEPMLMDTVQLRQFLLPEKSSHPSLFDDF